MALTTYTFSSDYQDELLATMVRNPELFTGLTGVIQYSYFTGTHSQVVCKLLLEFYKEQMVFPSFAQLGALIQDDARKSGNLELATERVAYVQKLSEVEVRAAEFNRDKVVQFAVTRACTNVLITGAKAIQENKDLMTLGLPTLFQEALNVGRDLNDEGYEAYEDVNKVLDKVLDANYGIYTGFDILDEKVWKRGWGPGWLVVPVAPPKRFKTAFCLNLALNMVGPQCGYDVLYYACEISSELALLRAYQRLANQTQDDLRENPDSFFKALGEGLSLNMRGKLHVKHYPSKTATISTIRAHALQIIQTRGYKPKAIIIDYAETVKPEGSKDEPEYRQQSGIYTAARALGDELGCAIIMPDRCNRETVDMAVPSLTSFQGAFEKAGIVDVAIGLCSTPEEAKANKIRYFIFANRHGEEGVHIRGKVDPERMILTMDEVLSRQDTANLEEKAARMREEKRNGKKRGGRSKDQALIDPRARDDDAQNSDSHFNGSPRASRGGGPKFEV
jgi:replicative DNA helicase